MRKETNKYFLSVEGETEKWYFDWLQRMINAETTARYTVKFDCPVQKNPLKRAKGLPILGKTEITHIMDRESEDVAHTRQFETTLNRMRDAEGLGKRIKYRLGYTNFTFELWIILHKTECSGHLTHRRQYLSLINSAFSEQFENLDQYKHETNFKRILSKLSLDDVRNATSRAKAITQANYEKGFVLHQHKRYSYYKENPSLSIWEFVESVMLDSFA